MLFHVIKLFNWNDANGDFDEGIEFGDFVSIATIHFLNCLDL